MERGPSASIPARWRRWRLASRPLPGPSAQCCSGPANCEQGRPEVHTSLECRPRCSVGQIARTSHQPINLESVPIARRFLHERFGRGVVDLRALCAGDMIAFVQRQTQRLQPPALKCIVNAMRSFLRYAQYRGEGTTALAAAVPLVAAWTTTPSLPKAIP